MTESAGSAARVLDFELLTEYRADELRRRYSHNWAHLRALILTRMSCDQQGSHMYTVSRLDSQQSCKLLAFDAFDALLKFHGQGFSRSYLCDQVDGRLRATHKDSGIEFVITGVEAYFSEAASGE